MIEGAHDGENFVVKHYAVEELPDILKGFLVSDAEDSKPTESTEEKNVGGDGDKPDQ